MIAVDVADWTQAVNVTGGSVAITGTTTVLISGQPVSVGITGANTVILGAGTAQVGSVSAINSTVTVAGTVNIGNTPSVTISGTPTVNINSGSVSITGQPVVNVQAANGVTIVGPNLLPVDMAGPLTGGWFANANCTLAFNADGSMTATQTNANQFTQVTGLYGNLTGPHAMLKVRPGDILQVTCAVKGTSATTCRLRMDELDQAANFLTTIEGNPGTVLVVNQWTLATFQFTVTDGPVYNVAFDIAVDANATGGAGATYIIDRVSVQSVGAFPMNAQQGNLPVAQNQASLGSFSIGTALSSGTFVVPKGTDAIALRIRPSAAGIGDILHITVKGPGSGGDELFKTYFVGQLIYSLPWLPLVDTTVYVEAIASVNNGGATMNVIALLVDIPELVDYFPQAQLRPNQAPSSTLLQLNNNTAGWIISPQANVEVCLFDLVPQYVNTAGGANYFFGFGSTLPVVSPASYIIHSGNTGSFLTPFGGAPLGRGNGVWCWNQSGQVLNIDTAWLASLR